MMLDIEKIDIYRIVYFNWVREGQTENQHEILAQFHEKREKRRILWWKKSCGFFTGTTHRPPSHIPYNIPVLDHLCYSPDLVPCEFYLKSVWNR